MICFIIGAIFGGTAGYIISSVMITIKRAEMEIRGNEEEATGADNRS